MKGKLLVLTIAAVAAISVVGPIVELGQPFVLTFSGLFGAVIPLLMIYAVIRYKARPGSA